MARRLVALLAILAFAVVACGGAPAASPISDPKEILVQSIGSLVNVKTVSIHGTFSGSVAAQGAGNFDLSSIKLDIALDVPGKKARLTLDAPTLLGTNVDVIAADNNAYVKFVGPLAAMVPGLDATGKYTKFAGNASSADAVSQVTNPAKAIEEIRTSLNSLPKQPQKLNDEQCSGTDCYHVQLGFTGQDLAALSSAAGSTASEIQNATFDLWTRKNDLRPGKFAMNVNAGAQGTITATFDLTYDQGVNIAAPPGDQVVEAPTSS